MLGALTANPRLVTFDSRLGGGNARAISPDGARLAIGETSSDRQSRVAGERADLDGKTRSDQRGEQRQELALLKNDLHAGCIAERCGAFDQSLLHVVGW